MDTIRKFGIDEMYCYRQNYGYQILTGSEEIAFIYQYHKSPQNGKPKTEVMLMPLSGGYPEPLGISHLNPSFFRFSPDETIVALVAEKGIYLFSPSDGNLRFLTGDKPDSVDINKIYTDVRQIKTHDLCNEILWSPNGKHLMYVKNNNNGYQDICLISSDGRSKEIIHLIEGNVISRAWVYDSNIETHKNQLIFTAQNVDGNTGYTAILDIETKECKIIHEENNCFYFKPLAAPLTNESFIVLSSQSGYSKLWQIGVNGDKKQLTTGEYDDTYFIVRGKNIFYSSRDKKSLSENICKLDILENTIEKLTDLPGISYPVGTASDVNDNQFLYYFHTSPVKPGDLFRIALHGGKKIKPFSFSKITVSEIDYDEREKPKIPERLTVSHPVWLEKLLSEPEVIYIDSFNQAIPTLIFKPKNFSNNQKYPAVISLKGGPVSCSTAAYEPQLQELANEGYIVIRPNYRGSCGFGTEFMNAISGGNPGKVDLEDILSVREYIKNLEYIDDKNIGITGKSWGGYLTLMAVSKYPGLFKCAAAHAAIYNWLIQQEFEDVRHYSYWLFGSWCYENEELFKSRSPLHLIDNIETPLLITHGLKDKNVPFVQAKDFFEKAKGCLNAIEAEFYEGEGHSYTKYENIEDYHLRTLKFLNKYLKPWNFKDNPNGNQCIE